MTIIKKQDKLEGHEKAARWFHSAAKAWIAGNNSGSNAMTVAMESRVDQLHAKAMEALVEIHGTELEIGFPGLYPVFRIGEREYHSVQELAAWAPRAGQA